MTIRHDVEDILRYHFGDYEDIPEATDKICDKIEDEILTAIKTAVTVRINGVPQ